MSSRLEQRSVIKFLLAEKCTSHEIFRRICEVYKERCFSQKRDNHEFSTTALNRKDSSFSENSLSGSDKVSDAVDIKESHIDSLLRHEGPITILILEEVATVNSASYCQLLRQNLPLILYGLCIYAGYTRVMDDLNFDLQKQVFVQYTRCIF